MDKLIDLYVKLNLINTSLVITDEIIGAGYILAIDTDLVVVRWGTYQEGIKILELFSSV